MRQLIVFILILSSSAVWSQKNIIQTGDPIPKVKINSKDCLDNSPTSVRLLGKTPHVPFAIVDKDIIKSAGQACCTEWATTQTEWYNLNENGKIVGVSKVQSGDGYDVSQCYELNLQTAKGEDGIGLFVSKEVDWEVDSSQNWQATKPEKEKLDSFIVKVNELILDNTKTSYLDSMIEGKMIFFKINPPQQQDENYVPPIKCVVFGKRYLMIAYMNNQNQWILAHIENEYTNGFYKLYTPIALMDINKDGYPEIVFQESYGHSFFDKIMRIQNKDEIESWQIEAKSVGGATL